MAASTITPPPGFELETAPQSLTPPPGFVLESQAPPQNPGPLAPPDPKQLANELSARYAPAMQMAMGGGGIKYVGEGVGALATNPAVREAAGKVADVVKAVDPDIAGMVSPLRFTHFQRLVGRFAEKLKGMGLDKEIEELKTALGPAAPEPALTKSTALATAETPAAKSVAQTGEALGGPAVKPVAPTPAPAITPTPAPAAATSTLPKGTRASQVIKTLNQAEALRQPVRDIVDTAVPAANKAANLRAKAEVEFYLKKGNVEAAEQALDKAASKANPEWGPERPPYRGTTNDIRAEIKAKASRESLLEDQAIQQEMNWNLERHGWAAESEARREFIARNSTGKTKGDLIREAGGTVPEKPVKYTKTPGVKAKPLPDDLTDILKESLARIKKK